jgi:hypothetical protein
VGRVVGLWERLREVRAGAPECVGMGLCSFSPGVSISLESIATGCRVLWCKSTEAMRIKGEEVRWCECGDEVVIGKLCTAEYIT